MSTWKLIAGVLFAVTASTIGDLLLAKGMKKVGQVEWKGVREAFRTVWRVLSRPEIPLAVLFLAVFFFTWLALLSRTDLSLILPLTALTYLFNGLAAGPVLGEKVSKQRWIGIWVITVGVILVSLSSGGPLPP